MAFASCSVVEVFSDLKISSSKWVLIENSHVRIDETEKLPVWNIKSISVKLKRSWDVTDFFTSCLFPGWIKNPWHSIRFPFPRKFFSISFSTSRFLLPQEPEQEPFDVPLYAGHRGENETRRQIKQANTEPFMEHRKSRIKTNHTLMVFRCFFCWKTFRWRSVLVLWPSRRLADSLAPCDYSPSIRIMKN